MYYAGEDAAKERLCEKEGGNMKLRFRQGLGGFLYWLMRDRLIGFEALEERVAALEKGSKRMEIQLGRLDYLSIVSAPEGDYDAQKELIYLVSLAEGLGRYVQRLNDALKSVRARVDRLRRQMEAAKVSAPELPRHQRPPRHW